MSPNPNHFREKMNPPEERLAAKFLSLSAEAGFDLLFISLSADTWSQLCPNSGLENFCYIKPVLEDPGIKHDTFGVATGVYLFGLS